MSSAQWPGHVSQSGDDDEGVPDALCCVVACSTDKGSCSVPDGRCRNDSFVGARTERSCFFDSGVGRQRTPLSLGCSGRSYGLIDSVGTEGSVTL